MLKRNKKIVAILTATMITSLVNTGVAFGENKEGVNAENSSQSSAVENSKASSSDTGKSLEVSNKENEKSNAQDNVGNDSTSNANGTTGEVNKDAETGSKLEDSTAEKEELCSSTVGASSEVTGTSGEVDGKSTQQGKSSSTNSSNANGTAEEAKKDAETENNIQANNPVQTSKLSADTKEVKANTSITLDIGGSNITITNGTGGSISVTGKGIDGVYINGHEVSTGTKIIITGGSKDLPSSNSIGINPTCMPTIIIDNAFINNGIYGGNITVKSGTVNGDIMGGFSEGTEAGNVVIEGGTINGDVFGGNTFNGTAGTVTIQGGTVGGAVGGASVTTAGGSVTVNGGEIKWGIRGGSSDTVTGGDVVITGGTIEGWVFGGNTKDGTGGKVIIAGGDVKPFEGVVIGGNSINGIGGDIIIEGGTIEGRIIEAGNSETATGGKVIMTGGTVKGLNQNSPVIVTGGQSYSGNGGSVSIYGGTIDGTVIGGTSLEGVAGTVTLIEGEVGNIIGGFAYNKKEAGTVTIKGGKVDGSVVGGISCDVQTLNAHLENNLLILNGPANIQGAVNIEGGTVGGMILSGVKLNEESGRLTMDLNSGVLTIEGAEITGNAVMINGGSVREIAINNLVNGNKSNVYKNTVKLPIDKDEEVTCSVDNGNSTWKAITLDNGYLYMYLPESKENDVHQIKVTDSKGKIYLYNVSTKTDGSSIAVPVVEKISLKGQPAEITKVTAGQIKGTLNVDAGIDTGKELSYQWYSNSTNSTDDGAPIDGATSSKFTIPMSLQEGEIYYYCVVSAKDCGSVTSNISKVVVDKAPIIEDSSSDNNDETAKLRNAKIELTGTLEKLIIDVSGKNIVDKEVLDYVRGKSNKQLVLQGEQYIWTINGQDITESNSGENLDAYIIVTYEKNGMIRVKVRGKEIPGKVTLKLKEINPNIQALKLYSVDKNNTMKLLNTNLKVNNKEVTFDLTGDREYILSSN